MFTAMNVVRAAYADHIARLYPAGEAIAVVRSVDKLLDIELALMLRHYQLVSEERIVRALQTMTTGLAHEVRNPLNAAKLQLELLERRLRRQGDDPKTGEPVRLAHLEIERLTALLNEFLAFSRPSELHLEEHDTVAVIRHVLELERPLAERNGVEIVLAAPAEATVRVDARKLHQIVQNLVRNGIEAIAGGGRVEVEIVLGSSELHIRITDTGCGIPDAVRSRMYEPFFSTKEAGTGMGMSIVHNLVSMHGGTIDLTSSAQGTVVDVMIPRR
jgi:signal transduction histidine kinase